MFDLDYFNDKWPELSFIERIMYLKGIKRVVFSTSFGPEDQYITHEIVNNILDVDFFTLDTGRLFNETYDLWSETEKKYNIKIKGYFPNSDEVIDYTMEYGINGFYDSIDARKACCNIRKVAPLLSAIKGYDFWISGLRRAQSENRKDLPFAEYDGSNKIIKLYPLADLSDDKLEDNLQKLDIPINPLHKKGFVSIGCAPCTRAISKGESPRAGRWWWEDSAQECGLHFVRGKMVKSKDLE